MREVTKSERDALEISGGFDADWYRRTYRDVDMLGMDPLEHYLWLGKRLGRRPNASFAGLADPTDASDAWLGPDFFDEEPKRCPYFNPIDRKDPFNVWQALNKDTPRSRKAVDQLVRKGKDAQIAFSILVPVYDPPLEVLAEAIESVLSQSYSDFELILVDDCSKQQAVRELIDKYARLDARIKPITRTQNGHISVATNNAADIATNDFLVFLDNDDMLDKHALALFAGYIADNPETDILYSDDAKMGPQPGRLHSPKFKPDWSPELLLSYCYISHLKALRRDIYNKIGGSRQGFEGSQDHDMLLRASEISRHIGHIPQILYQRRVLPGSTAATGNAKPYSFEAGRRAVEEAFSRRGVPCTVEHPAWARHAGVGIYTPIMPDTGPSVTILIPTKDNWRILDRLLRSLEKTAYKNYDVIIIDNDATDHDTLRYYKELKKHRIVKISNPGSSFSFAHINNEAAKIASGEFVLFLNDDTEVISPGWLSQMVGWARLPGVGAVGARLLFPDGRVQHAGVVMGLRCGLTAMRGLEGNKPGYLWYARVTRNVSAVTAACMLTPRRTFLELGGFDGDAFAVAYNDVDYCLRLHRQGLRSVFCGEAELLHHEGYTRPKGDNPREIAALRMRYDNTVDPYYNPHLGVDDNKYGVKPTVLPVSAASDVVRAIAISHNLNHEGAPNSAFELISGLTKRGKIEFTVLSPQDGPLRKRYEDAGISVQIMDRPRPLENLRSVEDYDERLRKFALAYNLQKFDVLYANTATAFWAIDAASQQHVPTIWNIRESESWKNYYDFLPRPVGHRALSCFAYPYRVIFVADATRRRWSPVDQIGNFDTIHNGLDRGRLAPPTEQERLAAREELQVGDRLCLLTVGTTAARKGQHEALQVLLALPPHIAAKCMVTIVGLRKGEYGRALEEFGRYVESRTRARILFVPETGSTRKYWAAADVFMCTSRLESYPRVILEAMACRLPIITTPVFGIREQVREGYNALLYKPRDLSTLAAHIERIGGDARLRLEMAGWSEDVLNGLESYDSMLAKYEQRFLGAANSAIMR